MAFRWWADSWVGLIELDVFINYLNNFQAKRMEETKAFFGRENI